MHCLCKHFDFIKTRYGNAFEEIFDVTISPLAGIGIRLFVKAKIAVVKCRSVGTAQFFVLLELAIEMPGSRFNIYLVQPQFDQSIRSQKVLIQQKTGCDLGLPDRINMILGSSLGNPSVSPRVSMRLPKSVSRVFTYSRVESRRMMVRPPVL